jgi:hypothetical protein
MTLFAKATLGRLGWPLAARLLPALSLLLFRPTRQQDIFNIVWALVFGFATLNILGMAARQNESNRRRLTFGEFVAILIVVVAVVLLAWEMLNLFHIFPIRLQLTGH